LGYRGDRGDRGNKCGDPGLRNADALDLDGVVEGLLTNVGVDSSLGSVPGTIYACPGDSDSVCSP
jgi:hypothetical protein